MLSYRNKILLDRLLGSICALIMNGVTRLVGVMFCRNHDRPVNPKVIVVAKIVGMGSILQSGALCRAFKSTFQDTRLIYLTSRGCRDLVTHMENIDEVLEIDDRSLFKLFRSTGKQILTLWSRRPDLYFDLELYSRWASIVGTLSLARNRYGFYRKSTNFKLGLYSHLLFFNTARYLADIYLELGRCAGAEGGNSVDGLLHVRDSERENCNKLLTESDIGAHDVVVVNPNASDLLVERRWPILKWKQFLEAAAGMWPDLLFVLTGAPSEKSYVEELYSSIGELSRKNIRNLAGCLDLGSFLALVERCKGMVTCDSGPMHMSIALNRPTLSIWGPTNPANYGADKNNHRMIYEAIYCSPCLFHADLPPCKGDNQCVKRISVQKVLREFAGLLHLTFDEGWLGSKFPAEDRGFNDNGTRWVLGLVERKRSNS